MSPTLLRPIRVKPKGLVQQQNDFTAEGSPPPGQVAATVPATPHTATKAATGARPKLSLPALRKTKPAEAGR